MEKIALLQLPAQSAMPYYKTFSSLLPLSLVNQFAEFFVKLRQRQDQKSSDLFLILSLGNT